ncbi:MAG: type II secretion system protein GspN [Nitrospinae bacterium]|nr:type II secretion system protein GspN [Nitrospinota bacterium]
MNIKRLFIAAGIIFTAVLLFLITFFFAFPNNLIESWLESELNERTGLVFSIEGFQKVFPLSFEMKKMEVIYAGDNTHLFNINNINMRFLPSSLILGNIKINAYGDVGGGHISEDVIIKVGGITLNTVAKNIGLKDIPSLNSVGLYSGVVNVYGQTIISQERCIGGFIKADGKDIDVSRLRIQGLIMPFEAIEKIGITTKLEECKLKLNGLWVEGKELSARLQGIVNVSSPFKNSPIDLTLEITPKAQLIKNDTILFLIKDYRKSINFYSIPIKGTIGNPVFIR